MMTLTTFLRWVFLFLILLFSFFSCQKQQPQTSQRLARPVKLTNISHQKGVLDILPLPSHQLISIGRDSLLILWQADSSKALSFKKLNAMPIRLVNLPNDRTFWVFLQNGKALQFSTENLSPKAEITVPEKNISQLSAFLPQKDFYLKAGANLLLFEPDLLKIRKLPFRFTAKDGFAVHKRQPLMAVFTNNLVRLFDLRTFKGLGSLTLPRARRQSSEKRFIQIVNSDLYLAALGENLWLIDWANQKVKRLPKSHLAPITTLAVSNVKGIGVSGSMDKSIKIWDLKNQELRASLYGHFFNITRLAIIDSLQQLVSASEDGTILFYDLSSFQILNRLGSIDVALRSPWQLKIRSVRTARAFKVGENEYNVSEPGTRLLKVNAEVKNISETEAMFFSSNLFLIDSSQARSPMVGLENYVALDPDAYFKKKLSPGQALIGNFVFIINQPYKNYRISYETLPPIALDKF